MARSSVHVARDILDKQIVDRDGKKMGRVDGLIGRVADGQPMVIESLELSWVTLGARLHPWIGKLVHGLRERWSVRRSARYHVGWDRVLEHDVHCVRVDLRIDETPAADWERWLRTHVVRKMPGADREEEEK